MKRKKKNNEEEDNEIKNIPVKLKNGKEMTIDCDEIVFDEKDCTLNYMLKGKTIYTIPLGAIADNE